MLPLGNIIRRHGISFHTVIVLYFITTRWNL